MLWLRRSVDVVDPVKIGGVAPPGVPRLAVEVDAGSTHTAAIIYRWDGGPAPWSINEVASAREEVGIAGGSPAEAGEVVKAVITRALNEAGQTVSMTAIRATAGMRELQKQNKEHARKVIAAVDEAVSSLTVGAFTGMRVIPAKEEV